MRSEFLAGLTELAGHDDRVVLLTADLGFGSIEVFSDAFPDRFFNVGVSEQGMIGLATGLAESGFIPYCYSIASFSVARTFEFLRNGPIAHHLPVRLIGIGPGVDYSLDGHTHYALEDCTLLMNQPNVQVIAPANSASAARWGRAGSSHKGLTYFRLARQAPSDTLRTDFPEPTASILLVAFGDAAWYAEELHASLRQQGIVTDVLHQEIVDASAMSELAMSITSGSYKVIVTLEMHYRNGGFGSNLNDALQDSAWTGRIIRWGARELPVERLGSQRFMLDEYFEPKSSLEEKVLRAYQQSGSSS